jgi:excisionase family DNA binding protein
MDARCLIRKHELLSNRDAAAYLGLTVKTLDGYRQSGHGPAFQTGKRRVYFRRADLDAWRKARSVISTR